MEKIVEKIVNWLQEQVSNAHAEGLVVGLSGGLDSAVVANLMKRAFPNNSLAVVMPLKSSAADLEDAKAVIAASGIEALTIDLSASHQLLYNEIQKQIADKDELARDKDRLADANLRARLRMSTLYTVATNYNYLVVGTDNMAEWYTGYFTKYGDGGVDLQPIVDLTKQEVRELAAYLSVPQSVITKNPSADLWVGQTDEEEMGTTYDHIDAYLLGKSVPKADEEIIENLHERTRHKRKIATQLSLK